MAEFPYDESFGYGPAGDPESRPADIVPESQKILSGLLSELPEQAQSLMNRVERELDKLQQDTEEKIAAVREQAEKRVSELESKAENRRKALLEHAVEQLEPMQKDYFRAGELAQALAAFVKIQMLKSQIQNVLPDPGNLLQHHQIGKTFHFRVIGSNNGPVWGTDIYTSDSHLSTAAVHAGALEFGEEGVVRVSTVDMSRVQVRGSMRNGVMTMDWGPYDVGYRVARG